MPLDRGNAFSNAASTSRRRKQKREDFFMVLFFFVLPRREREKEKVLGTTGVCVHEYFFWIMVPSSVLFMPSAMIMSCGRTFRFWVRFLTTQ